MLIVSRTNSYSGLLCSLIIGGTVFLCPLEALADNRGYILSQRSGVTGESQVYVTAGAMKLVQKSTGCVLIMKAPEWNVVQFNSIARVIYKTDAEHWQGRSSFIVGLVSGGRFSSLVSDGKKATGAKIAGMPARVVRIIRPGKPPPDTREYKTELLGATYAGATDLPIPPKVALVVQRYYRLPTLSGFPLKVEIINCSRVTKVELDTLKCERRPIPDSTFVIPRDYRPVASEEAVAVGNQQNLLEDISEGLGRLGSPSGTNTGSTMGKQVPAK